MERLLPARRHFSRLGHEEMEEGREGMRLSVRISQRSLGGRVFSGMLVSELWRKATISRVWWEERSGKVVKAQLERKRILRLGREVVKLGGREERPVPERSR